MLQRFARLRVVVIGDMMLDQYIIGRVSRISPEAPVPVVDVQTEKFFPGGASNVARNLSSLGAHVDVLGVVGSDAAGRTLVQSLKDHKINTLGLLKDSGRPTTLKTRIMAQHQQMVRFDRESRAPLTSSLMKKALQQAEVAISKADAVIFEDYGKGFIHQPFLDQCVHLAHEHEVITLADPNVHHRLNYRHLTGITPNRNEAFWMVNELPTEPAAHPLSDKPLLEVGRRLLRDTHIENVLITLGEHGMCLFRKDKPPHHIPTAAREVFDVSGAGDTAISVFALGLCAELDATTAAYLSNQASGIVVGKAGTATVTPGELLEKL